MQRGCLLGAQIAIILRISFTVLYAGYPYEIPGLGLEKSVVSVPGFELGTFCSRVECPNQYTTGGLVGCTYTEKSLIREAIGNHFQQH